MSEAGKKTARNYKETGVSSVAINQHWETSPVLVVGNRKVEAGEIIKISQVWGTKFKFIRYVYNPKTDTSWIDCAEMHRNQWGQTRSFRVDRVKLLPKRRNKKKKETKSTQ